MIVDHILIFIISPDPTIALIPRGNEVFFLSQESYIHSFLSRLKAHQFMSYFVWRATVTQHSWKLITFYSPTWRYGFGFLTRILQLKNNNNSSDVVTQKIFIPYTTIIFFYEFIWSCVCKKNTCSKYTNTVTLQKKKGHLRLQITWPMLISLFLYLFLFSCNVFQWEDLFHAKNLDKKTFPIQTFSPLLTKINFYLFTILKKEF